MHNVSKKNSEIINNNKNSKITWCYPNIESNLHS